ncbi:hypothetical protein GCM10010831_16250 [Psychroflexus salis]|uniref:Uncharacterized protein n=2 Tax=Psychroflexus salis TaxID=1526574 RepID=A0A916ZW81_9FLAO|nr:hypothetical protein GCM10010831_16250 [Psychroflexus salis]
MQNMELLNSEGPILRAIKYNSNRYDIIDQYNLLVDILNEQELQDFVHSDREIVDSKKRKFKYSSFPSSMKPDLKLLNEFIGMDSTEKK